MDETRRKTLAIIRSVIPSDLRVPIVGMLRKSIISRPETMLKPATTVIRIRITNTLKSSRESQSKICGYLSITEVGISVSSSSP